MIEIGSNLAITLKTLIGCSTTIYIARMVLDLIKSTPSLQKLPDLELNIPKLNKKTITTTEN